MNTARITGLELADDGVFLVKAVCQTCHKTVLHGAGDDIDALVLGHRAAHCGCTEGGYDLVDPHGIVRLRLRVIRERDYPEFLARQAHDSHLREIKEARERLDQAPRYGSHEELRAAQAHLARVIDRGPQVAP